MRLTLLATPSFKVELNQSCVMYKSILLPAFIASVIAMPLIYQKSTSAPRLPNGQNGQSWSQGPRAPYNQQVRGRAGLPNQQARSPQSGQSEIYGGTVQPQSIFHANPPANPAPPRTAPSVQQVAAPTTEAAQPFSLPALRTPADQPSVNVAPVSQAALPSQNSITAADAWGITNGPLAVVAPAALPSGAPVSGSPVAFSGTPDITGLTPDFGKAETTVYRGTAAGPDLTAQPLSFVPVNDFREVFRFDINESWVKQRFKRISTVPADADLHGLRTAMVTGTNSWDLHGSQTYYFDTNHRLQRITFRGWVGDSTRLLEMATKHFGLKPQPTHWAGLYLGNFGGKLTGGLIMKDPDVIDQRNQLQRSAVLMELNQPSGKFQISDDFRGLLRAAAGK